MTKRIDRMHAHSGRYLKENDNLVNLADIGERISRTLNGINSLQVSEAFPVVSLKSNYGISVLRDKVTETGSGTVTNTVGDGYYSVSSGATTGSTAILESVERGRYVAGSVANPGVGVRVVTPPTGDGVARWGYYDDNDGLGFGIDANGVFLFRRYKGSDTVIRRANWDDPLDGTGPSTYSFATGNYNIYATPFRWYGSGPAVFEVSGTGSRTDTVFAHTLEVTDELIVSDPNLPLRVEVDNGTSTDNIEVRVGGRQFSILGRYQPNRRITSDYRLQLSVPDTSFIPILAFRQKTAYTSVSVKAGGLDLLSANADLLFQVRIGSALTGAVFTAPSDVDPTETALEFDKQATALTGGQKIYEGLAGGGAGSKTVGSGIDIPDFDFPVGSPVVLCARAVSGTATVTATIRAREEW